MTYKDCSLHANTQDLECIEEKMTKGSACNPIEPYEASSLRESGREEQAASSPSRRASRPGGGKYTGEVLRRVDEFMSTHPERFGQRSAPEDAYPPNRDAWENAIKGKHAFRNKQRRR